MLTSPVWTTLQLWRSRTCSAIPELSRRQWPRWKEAMDREMQSLNNAKTRRRVARPPRQKVVGSQWVFRKKRKADGSI